MIKLAIVDDHKMFRDGMAFVLNDHEEFEVIWTAESTMDTLQKINTTLPDIICMDVSLGAESGIKLTEQIMEDYENISVIGLSMHHEEQYILKMIEAGAKGYVLKDAGIEELKKAISKVDNLGYFYSDHVMHSLVHHINNPQDTVDKSITNVLTQRELEVLHLVAEELSNIEISKKLFISPRTVETHKRNMISKLNVKNSIGLVRFAFENGIIASKQVS